MGGKGTPLRGAFFIAPGLFGGARAGLEMGSQSTTTTGGDANPRGNGHPGSEPGPQGNTTAFDDIALKPLNFAPE